jgi:hypothetical protein
LGIRTPGNRPPRPPAHVRRLEGVGQLAPSEAAQTNREVAEAPIAEPDGDRPAVMAQLGHDGIHLGQPGGSLLVAALDHDRPALRRRVALRTVRRRLLVGDAQHHRQVAGVMPGEQPQAAR